MEWRTCASSMIPSLSRLVEGRIPLSQRKTPPWTKTEEESKTPIHPSTYLPIRERTGHLPRTARSWRRPVPGGLPRRRFSPVENSPPPSARFFPERPSLPKKLPIDPVATDARGFAGEVYAAAATSRTGERSGELEGDGLGEAEPALSSFQGLIPPPSCPAEARCSPSSMVLACEESRKGRGGERKRDGRAGENIYSGDGATQKEDSSDSIFNLPIDRRPK